MIKRTLLAAAIFSALPAYAGLTSITAGYDFTDYSGDHGNRNLAYAELVAKVENATLLFNLSQGRRDYETEHFNATRGQGAQLNGYRLRGSTARDLDGTILATGFPFKAKQYATTYINIVGKLFNECADFRRTGSAALDLAYVAAGRVDGFFEIGLRPWDFAAGELLVREAGGIVSDFTGGHNYMLTGNIVAGNPRVVKAMLANMRDELSDALKR
nr:inositol-1-monophosphatase [uncultured bacterium]